MSHAHASSSFAVVVVAARDSVICVCVRVCLSPTSLAPADESLISNATYIPFPALRSDVTLTRRTSVYIIHADAACECETPSARTLLGDFPEPRISLAP